MTDLSKMHYSSKGNIMAKWQRQLTGTGKHVHGSTTHDKNIPLMVKCLYSIKKQTSYVITDIVKTKENRTNFHHRKPLVINAIDRNLGSPLTGNFKKQLEGSRKRVSLFVGALLAGLLSGDTEGHGEEGSGDGQVRRVG
jgi:hypothetical protein